MAAEIQQFLPLNMLVSRPAITPEPTADQPTATATHIHTEGCAIRIQDYVADVRKIRKAMNTDPAAPKGFYTSAYVIIDQLEKYASAPAGEDDTEGWLAARPLIYMEGHALGEWIAAHPLQ